MNWFRLYNDVPENVKVATLSYELRWRWIQCLSLASKNGERGYLPALRQIAFTMRVSEDEATTAIDGLVAAGLVDRVRGRLFMHDWDTHQPPSDNAADRMRRLRESRAKAGRDSRSEHVRPASSVTRSDARSEQVPNVFGEDRTEQNRKTPQTPLGGGAVVRDSAKAVAEKPKAAEPDEPFVPPPSPPPSADDFTPAERRLLSTAESLFPGSGYGQLVIASRLDLDVAGRALADLKASGKSDWSYFGGIYRRLVRDGVPAAPPPPKPYTPPPSPIDAEDRARVLRAYQRRPGLRSQTADPGQASAATA